ncbi:ferredoxin [Myxococcota bacterium]|nr:ferredoxin [Myxococcota bacterium]
MPWRVDERTCIGCSVCTDASPEVFWLDEDAGFARVKAPSAPEDRPDCREAGRGCPVEAISFTEREEGGETEEES